MDILISNGVKRISGPISLFVLRGDNKEILLFGDLHEDEYLCNSCSVENGCYEMNDIYKILDDNVGNNTELYIELMKNNESEIVHEGQLKKFSGTKNININKIDIRTPEFLDGLIMWIKTQIIAGNNYKKAFENYYESISNILEELDSCINVSYLSNYPDLCELFNIYENKYELAVFLRNLFLENSDSLVQSFNIIYKLIIDDPIIENNLLYYYVAVIAFPLVDLFTIILIDYSPKSIQLYYAGEKHMLNIYNYFSSHKNFSTIRMLKGNRYNKCLEL